VVTDSRIKTFVYNENDVYNVLTHYGYQSNIEFGRNEEVQTISVGDRVAWQIIPAGRRLFVKAMEENAHTNMTVVTNKRAYQFDLASSGQVPLHPSEELVYVVRFYYPDEHANYPSPAIYSDGIANAAPTPEYNAPVVASPAATSSYNYNYTFTGPSQAAPLKIYDDGQTTYFKFSQLAAMPQFFVLTPDGKEHPVQPQFSPDGEVFVATTAPRFSIRQGATQVIVFNEAYPQQQMM
jgi:type IV secretion system protein VirB9